VQVWAAPAANLYSLSVCIRFLLKLTVCNSAVNVVLPAKGDSDPKEEAVPEQYVFLSSIRLYPEWNSNLNIFQIREYHQGWQAGH
jgi:hypothetical protein